jgi:hypothetical protein
MARYEDVNLRQWTDQRLPLFYRISGPYQESPLLPITGGMEFLIGTIRFQVSSGCPPCD